MLSPLTPALALIVMLLFSNTVFAILQPLKDSELSEISGRAIMAITRLDSGDTLPQGGTAQLDFVKLTMGLDIEINANIERLTLGQYNRNGCTASDRCSADIDLEYLSLGSVNPSTGEMTHLRIIDPYLEFAIDDSSGRREVKGFRLGASYQQGIIASKHNVISGNIGVSAHISGGQFDAVAAALAAAGTELIFSREGERFTELSDSILGIFNVDLYSAPTMNLEGARNFWLSLQDSAINYPNWSCVGATGCESHATAQAGFWLNMADHVAIRNLIEADNSNPIILRFYNQFPINCWNGSLQAIHGVNDTSITAGSPLCR